MGIAVAASISWADGLLGGGWTGVCAGRWGARAAASDDRNCARFVFAGVFRASDVGLSEVGPGLGVFPGDRDLGCREGEITRVWTETSSFSS